MKIVSVDVIRAKMSTERASDGTRWDPTFVRINTDAGVSGYGEVGLAYSDGIDAGFGICTDFARYIIGMDPLAIEKVWDRLHRGTFWGQGGGGVVFAGMSAIDMALWDIKGKYFNAPVHQLLGGKTRDKIRAYASQVQFDWAPVSKNLVTEEEYREVTRQVMADGYDALKVDPLGVAMNGEWEWDFAGILSNRDIDMAVSRVAAIRETGGRDMDIIIELHAQTDVNGAIQLGKALEPFKCFYMEEPTQSLNPAIFRNIAEKVDIPLASGERIYSRWGYRPFLEDRSLSVIQPDLGNCGGITEGKKICDMARTYDVGVQPHICGGPIATAAALQLEAVIPNFIIHEQHQYALIDENIALCKYDYQPKNGYFDVPDRPGLGNELSDETLKNAYIVTIDRA